MANVIAVSDVFELAGEFSDVLKEKYAALSIRADVDEVKELVRLELELVEDLCTNVPESLTEAHLLRVAEYLNAKLDSLE